MMRRSFAFQCALITLLASVCSVKCHLEVSSNFILMLHGTTSELTITYYQHPVEESVLELMDPWKTNNVSKTKTTEVEYKMKEKITVADHKNNSSTQVKQGAVKYTLLEDISTPSKSNHNTSKVKSEETNNNVSETVTPSILDNISSKEMEFNEGVHDLQRVNKKLTKDIELLEKDIKDLKQVVPVTTEVNDRQVYNTSLYRKRRDFPIIDTDSMSTSTEAENSYQFVIRRVITVKVNHEYVLSASQSLFEINESLPIQSWRITLNGYNPGNAIVLIQLQPYEQLEKDVVVHVDVEKGHHWTTLSTIIGWIYFVSWGASAHCQVLVNWQRKSVVGLNFDYLGLNMIGHSLYGVYNFVLYFSYPVQEEYYLRNPHSANPIQLNDVVFSAHNSLVTLYTVYQCYKYERGNQRLSKGAKLLYTVYAVWVFLSGFLALVHKIHWLDFINQCALIKLTITLIKYAPQAYMNFKRKSTVGWSIGNVLLDFAGGLFSLLQMLILAYNFDDWNSLLTDTTKLGLAAFTLMFDVLFLVQHYILYTDHDDKPYFVEEDIEKKADTGIDGFKSTVIY
ncbi:hypothetical protein M8J75_003489 [Diaphorina citri]|nr:hypothetical protein M8J75_003489 [Diaphorina citri]